MAAEKPGDLGDWDEPQRLHLLSPPATPAQAQSLPYALPAVEARLSSLTSALAQGSMPRRASYLVYSPLIIVSKCFRIFSQNLLNFVRKVPSDRGGCE